MPRAQGVSPILFRPEEGRNQIFCIRIYHSSLRQDRSEFWFSLNQDWTNPDCKPDFYVENNMIVCNTTMNSAGGYLVTEELYDNFILEFDVKIDTSLNSGLQCRSRVWENEWQQNPDMGKWNPGSRHNR